MIRLDQYRKALLAAFADIAEAELVRALVAGGSGFPSFVVDLGLGPLWHERTGRDEFRDSRFAAEAFYLVQQHALMEIDKVLNASEVEYACIKGAANRQLLYDNPAVRSCHDIDLIVKADERVRAAKLLYNEGFQAYPKADIIGTELLLRRDTVDIDLHWRLLREGRLRIDITSEFLGRRQRMNDIWVLSPEDTMLVLLVHPAFAKHLDCNLMGLNRVVDILEFFRTQEFDEQTVIDRLKDFGVAAAAWSTLQWVKLLAGEHAPPGLDAMLALTRPGRIRRSWLNLWLSNDWSSRTASMRWVRLLGFSTFLHDTPADVRRALIGRRRSYNRQAVDLAAFSSLGRE